MAGSGSAIGGIIGVFFFGIIVVVIAAYIAKRRRHLKDAKKEIIQRNVFATNDNDSSNVPPQSNGKNCKKNLKKIKFEKKGKKILSDLHKISIEEDEGEHDKEIENVKIREQPSQITLVPVETEVSVELTEAPAETKVETQP